MAKLLQIESVPLIGVRQNSIPLEELITKNWDKERFAYEIMRHQRVKAETDEEEFLIPRKFADSIKLFVETFPDVPVQCEMYFLKVGDNGRVLPPPKAKNLSTLITRFGIAVTPHLGAVFNRFCLLSKSASLESLVRWSDAHLIILDLQATFLCLIRGDLPIQSQCQTILKQYLPRMTFQTEFIKVLPNPPDLRILAPSLLSWVRDRNCLIQLLKGNRLSFLRNEEGRAIRLNDVEEIVAYIERGAVAFIPDTCCFQSNLWVADVGCVDIDLKTLIDYERVRARIMDYLHFLEEEVQIKPIITHSGNQSYHVRILLAPTEIGGYFLPRKRPFESFIRTIQEVAGVVTIKDAIEIITMAYNRYTRLGKVMRKGTKLREFYFDNRTGINTGARCPGSWRPKSNTLSRNFNRGEIPSTLEELRRELNADAIVRRVSQGEESLVTLPQVDFHDRNRNVENLVKYARDFIEEKLEPLWSFYDARQDPPICRDGDSIRDSA